jgi:hypothetical protein
MTPDLTAIFAFRLATGRKLLLIAMIHRARDGCFKCPLSTLTHDTQIGTHSISTTIHALARAGVIHEDPTNPPRGGVVKVWRIDPKFIIGNQNGKSGMDGGRGRDAASVVDGGTVSGGNRAADIPAEKQRHQQKPSPAP